MRLLVIHGVHMLNEAQDLIGIADLVIIPGDHLHKGVGERNARLGVEDVWVSPRKSEETTASSV